MRAQGLAPTTIRLLIAAEAGTVALAGAAAGLVGDTMGYYFIKVLRPFAGASFRVRSIRTFRTAHVSGAAAPAAPAN